LPDKPYRTESVIFRNNPKVIRAQFARLSCSDLSSDSGK